MPETPDGSNVPSEVERFLGFYRGVQKGAPIPPVEPAEIRSVRNIYKDAARHFPNPPGGAISSVDLLARGCSPGTNTLAMSLRCQILEIMLTVGVFSEFQHGDDLDHAVYQTAATLPLNGFHIDPDTFVQYIREEKSRLSETRHGPGRREENNSDCQVYALQQIVVVLEPRPSSGYTLLR